jgi:hypothetical protein
MSPDTAQYPLWAKSLQVENHYSKIRGRQIKEDAYTTSNI